MPSTHPQPVTEKRAGTAPALVRACDRCGTLAYADDLYCSCCGTQLRPQRYCRHCNAPVRHPLAIHCTRCGEELGEVRSAE